MTGNNKLDERQKVLIGKAMAISAVLVFIYEIAIIIYTFNKTGSIKSVYTEIILILAMLAFIVMYYIVTADYDSSIEKGNRKINLLKIDEREKVRIMTSVGMAGFVAILYLAAITIFKLFQTKSFESSYLQIAPLLIMTVTNAIYLTKNKEFNIPTTWFGKKLPLGNSKADKRSRMLYYVKDALRLSTVFLIFDIMNPDRLAFSIPTINWRYIPYILNFIARSIIFVIIDYAWGEFNIKKQRKFNQSLDDGDIDDI